MEFVGGVLLVVVIGIIYYRVSEAKKGRDRSPGSGTGAPSAPAPKGDDGEKEQK